MADDLMTKAEKLHLQRLEEKLLLAETSLKTAESSLQTVESSLREKEQEARTMKIELEDNQKAHANEIDEIKSRHASEIDETKSRHNGDLKELREDGEKSWTLVNHLMKALEKSKELMKSREELVVAQAAKLKEVEKEVTECKGNVASKVAKVLFEVSKAENVTEELMQTEQGNWEVLDQCQKVIEKQSSSFDLLSTIAGYGVAKNISLDNDWTTHWSAWKLDKCEILSLTNGTIIECGEGGTKTRKRLKDLNSGFWEEDVEEVACQSCESFAVRTHVCLNYNELNSPTRRSSYAIKSPRYCDTIIRRDWKSTGWYRITGEAGTKLIDSPVDDSHCGTYGTGWLSGGHPTVAEGEVDRTVNFNYYGDNAKSSSDIKVVNCNTHYVYYLVRAPLCNLGYCTE